MRALLSRALCFAFLLVTAATAWPGVVRVPGDQPTIQAGVDAAADGDTVLVAAGTYAEGILIDGRAIAVTSEDGPEMTTIDASGLPVGIWIDVGERSGPVVKGFTVTNATSQGVMCVSGASPQLVDMILMGNAAYGVETISASPSLTGCVFQDNGGHGMLVRGGDAFVSSSVFFAEGLRVIDDGHAHLTECSFDGLPASGARDLRSPGATVTGARLTALGCAFRRYNELSALRLYETGPVALNDCTFSGNSGDLGPAFYCEDSPVQVTGCTFESNSSTDNGGAVVLRLGDIAEFTDCRFVDNSTPGLGGAVSAHGILTVRVSGCEFLDNYSGNDGGGLRVYGPEGCDLQVDHCLFVRNKCGGTGSAIRISSCDAVVSNCTVVDCTSPPSGAAVHIGGTDDLVLLHECIVANGTGYGLSITSGSLLPYVRYCDVFDMSSGLYAPPLPDYTGCYGDISADPMFCKPSEDDYRLDEYSPCATGGSGGSYIGAFGVGCGGTPVEEKSWGSIKAMFR